MPNIDELTVQFKSRGIGTVVKNINNLASAFENMANKTSGLDASKVSALASALGELKGKVPTKTQVTNLDNLATAISNLNTAASGGSISEFTNNMASLSNSLNTVKGTPANDIKKLTSALTQAGSEAKKSAGAIGEIASKTANIKTPKMPKLMPEKVDNKIDIKTNAKQVAAEFEQVNQHLVKSSDLATKFGRTLADNKILTPSRQMKSLQEQTEKVRQKYESLRETMVKATQAADFDPASKSWEKQSAELDAIRQKYNDLIMKQKELALAGGGFSLNPAITGTLEAFKNGFTQTASVIGKGFVGAVRKANSALGSLLKNIVKTVTASKALGKAGNNVKDLAKKLSSELLRVSKMLKLMVTRMALRKVIEEVGNGFKSLAIHSEQFDASMSAVINASKQLGYSFASMVSPLINALAPAIVNIINLLTELLNKINQVLSALSGLSTWNRAIKFTDKWSDSIKEAGKSGSKAAKELKKTVLGFDELNQLQDNKNKGGGGGSDIKDMFETVPIDPKWKEFADWLKDMWKMGDFTELGTFLGEKLRDFLRAIPWEEFKETARKLGSSLATLINGFVEVEGLGWEIGNAIAQSLNTIFEFVNEFVHKIHWDSIGKFIAETFNGFFENIDWALIKDTVVTGLAGIAETIQTFIDTFHWDNISNFIINALDTISSGIKAFFEGIKWRDLGQKIGDQIAKTIKGTNWKQIGEAIGDMIQAAIDFVAGLVEKLDATDVIKALGDLFEGIMSKVDTEKAGENLGKILQFIIDVVKGFFSQHGGEILAEVGKFFKGFLKGVDTADLIRGLYLLLNVTVLGGIKSALGFLLKTVASWGVGKMIMNAMFGGGGAAAGAGASAGASGAAAAGAKALFSGAEGTFLASAEAAGTSIGLTVIGAVTAVFAGSEVGKISWKWLYPDELDDLKEKYSGLGGTLKMFKDLGEAAFYEVGEAAKTFGDRTKEHLMDFATNVAEKSQKSKESATTCLDNIKEATKTFAERTAEHYLDWKQSAETSFGNVTEAAKTFVDRTNEHWNNAADKLAGFSDKVGEKVGGIKDKFNDLKESGGQRLQAFASACSEKAENVKNSFGNLLKNVDLNKVGIVKAFDEMKSQASEHLNTAKEKIAEFKEDLSAKFADAKSKIDEFKNNVATKLTEVKEEFGTLKDKIAEAFSKDKWTFSGVSEGLKETFSKAKDAIKGVWNGIAEKLNGDHEVGSTKIKIDLPKFAGGGFPEDGLFMANRGELVGSFSNGKTAVANNEQIISGIERGVYNAVTSAMSQGGRTDYISNTIVVDGDVIARSITKAQESTNRRYSPQTV